eukprot:jgi/Mesen1/1924/ME000146S01014
MWWRSQAVRVFLRWPTPYLCHIINKHLIEVGDRGTLHDRERDILQQVDLGVRSLQNAMRSDWKPYIMRPIVSLHVRQGDKAGEMHIFSLAAYVWLLERLRLHVPHLHHVWLSTEMQIVVEQSAAYADWTFWFSQIQRQNGTTTMSDYEAAVGEDRLTDISFANLIISSECDYFVGTLGSNWERLINELRVTNGRLKAGYLSPNYEEW